MSETSIKKQLNRTKKAIISHLRNADYEIIKSDNETICVIGARDTEWRCIKGDFRSISKHEVKKLERLPCPGGKAIKKELWLRNPTETQFYKLCWDYENAVWIDQFDKVIRF